LFLQLLYVAFDTVSAVKVKKKINNLLEINNVFLGLKKGGQVRKKLLKPTKNPTKQQKQPIFDKFFIVELRRNSREEFYTFITYSITFP
jgi:hypothetical protein